MTSLPGLLAVACLTAAAIAARAPLEPAGQLDHGSSAAVDPEFGSPWPSSAAERTSGVRTATGGGGGQKAEGNSSAAAESSIPTEGTEKMHEEDEDEDETPADTPADTPDETPADDHRTADTPAESMPNASAENITCGPIAAGATSISITAGAASINISLGMCFTLTAGDNAEIQEASKQAGTDAASEPHAEVVCIAGLEPMRLVSPTQFSHPSGSTLTLLEGVTAASNETMVVHVTDQNRSAFAGWIGWVTAKAGKWKTTIRPPMNTDGLLPSEIAAEFIATMLFVIVGCGSACGIADKEGSAWVLQVALTFGFAITVLEYTIGHYSGGQINCAVTFGLVLAKKLGPFQGFLYLLAQMGGSVAGALVLRVMYSDTDKDQTKSLGSNYVNLGFSVVSALMGEIVGTFVLMYVVMETEMNPASEAHRAFAPIAIGLAVFLAHSVLIPIDGCSINPTRSFGPALVATLTMPSGKNHFMDMWIFWVGPLIGAALAVGVYSLMVA